MHVLGSFSIKYNGNNPDQEQRNKEELKTINTVFNQLFNQGCQKRGLTTAMHTVLCHINKT